MTDHTSGRPRPLLARLGPEQRARFSEIARSRRVYGGRLLMTGD